MGQEVHTKEWKGIMQRSLMGRGSWCEGQGVLYISAKLFLPRRDWKRWTSNIERPTSNVEWGKMEKQTYDLEERLLEYSVRIIKIVEQLPNTIAGNHVAGQLLRSWTSPYEYENGRSTGSRPWAESKGWKETEIAVECLVLDVCFFHALAWLDVRCSMLDVHLFICSMFIFQNTAVRHKCNLWMFTK